MEPTLFGSAIDQSDAFVGVVFYLVENLRRTGTDRKLHVGIWERENIVEGG
jgi:hypothetical protein